MLCFHWREMSEFFQKPLGKFSHIFLNFTRIWGCSMFFFLCTVYFSFPKLRPENVRDKWFDNQGQYLQCVHTYNSNTITSRQQRSGSSCLSLQCCFEFLKKKKKKEHNCLKHLLLTFCKICFSPPSPLVKYLIKQRGKQCANVIGSLHTMVIGIVSNSW